MFNRKQINKYIKEGCYRCPGCGNDDFIVDTDEASSNTVEIHVRCNGCKEQWTEVYKLVDVKQERE